MAKQKLKLNEITIGGVNQKELTAFTRQFATLTNAGLTAIRSLEQVDEKTMLPQFYPVA